MSKIIPEVNKLPAPTGIDPEGLGPNYAHSCWVLFIYIYIRLNQVLKEQKKEQNHYYF